MAKADQMKPSPCSNSNMSDRKLSDIHVEELIAYAEKDDDELAEEAKDKLKPHDSQKVKTLDKKVKVLTTEKDQLEGQLN